MHACIYYRGAKVNLQSNDGRTALHEAAEGGHLEIVNSLLQNGANPFMFAGEYTPLDLASKVVHNRPVRPHIYFYYYRYNPRA